MDKQHYLNNLQKTLPDNFKKYKYDLLPDEFHWLDKLEITCIHHGVFYQKPIQHRNGQGCPKCGIIKTSSKKILTNDAFISRSKNIFSNKFNYVKTKYIKNDVEVIITCPHHGDFHQNPVIHLKSDYGCPKCNIETPKQIKKDKFITHAKNIHGNRYDYSKVAYVNFNESVEIICPNHGSFWQQLYTHAIKKQGCPKCAIESDKLTTAQFINKARGTHSEKYSYVKTIYERTSAMVTITCRTHGDFTQRAGSHLAGAGCTHCKRVEQILPSEQFISNAKLIHGEKYDYSKMKYLGNKKPIEIICPNHGSFWQRPNTHVSSKNGCSLCSESKGEKSVELFLKKYNLKHIREYKIQPYRYRYDFYLPDFNIYIEFNGIQHYKAVELFGGDKGYLETKERDLIKKKLIKENNGSLIIVTYLQLNECSVEKVLINYFKRVYNHWFIIDGEVRAFKSLRDLYKEFNISDKLPFEDVMKNFQRLFK